MCIDIKKNGGDRQDKAHHKYGKSNISNKRFERKPTTFLIDSSFKEQYTADYDNASLKSEDFDEDEEEYGGLMVTGEICIAISVSCDFSVD